MTDGVLGPAAVPPVPATPAAVPLVPATPAEATPLPRSRAVTTLPVLLFCVVCTSTAQQALFPVLPPLTRVLGLSEVQLGLVQSSASIMFAASSLLWARMVDRWGTRRVLLTGILLVLSGLVGLAAVCWMALDGPPTPGRSLALLILTRGLMFGSGLGAVPVAALSHVSRTSVGEPARVRAVGQLGAAQGLALALGPALAAVLGITSLLGPIWGTPVVVTLALVTVLVLLPPATGRAAVPAVRLRPWDPRVRPFLATGFLVFSSWGLTLVVLGFSFQDRLHLDADRTIRLAGASAFATGVVLVLGQGLLVRRLAWPPTRLLRVGIPIALSGFLGFAVAHGFWEMMAANATIGLGMALSVPGYTAGATLRVERHEQSAVAGLISAGNGATFIAAPLAGTALYQLEPSLPMLASAACAACALAVAVAHPGLRRPSSGHLP